MGKLFLFISAIVVQVVSFSGSVATEIITAIDSFIDGTFNHQVVVPPIELPTGIHDPSTQKDSYTYTHSENGVTVTAQLGNDQVSKNAGIAYLLLTLEGQELPDSEKSERQPLNVSIVIDRSGSMSGQKLSSVKQALRDITQYVTLQDRVSLVIYDETVETLLEPQPFDSELFIQKVSAIESGGSTNLEGGLRKGLLHVSALPEGERLNRVILLSDGLANVGVETPQGLARIVEQEQYQNISVSTIGVEADYDEKIMTTVAKSGRGNYYFMESPSQADQIFAQEFENATQLIAQNVKVTFNTDSQFAVTRGVGYEYQGDSFFKPYDVQAAKKQTYLFEIKAEQLEALRTGTVTLADVEFSYFNPISKQQTSFELPISIEVIAKAANPLADNQVYQEFIESYLAEELWDVYGELDIRNNQQAKQKLDEVLLSVEAANTRLEGALDDQVDELKTKQQFVEELKDEYVNDSATGKVFQKSVQFESYRKMYNK